MATISILIVVCSFAAVVAENTKVTAGSAQFPVSKVCREKFSTAASGSIQPFTSPNSNDNGNKECSFIIEAPADQLILISCSIVNLTSPGSELIISGGAELDINPPLAKRVYTSRGPNIYVFSRMDSSRDWFHCPWTTTPTPQTTEFKLCRDGRTTATRGTIERWEEGTDRQGECVFTITVPHHLDIQISCSNISLITPGSSLLIQGVNGPLFANPPIANLVYTLNTNSIYLLSRFGSSRDSFKCDWKTFTAVSTNYFKLCRDERTTSSNGTIQPLSDKKMRECYFTIDAPPDRLIQISCSTVSLINPGSYLSFHGISDVNVLKPVVNRLYTSSSNLIHFNSLLGKEDWFECKWDTILVPTTTDFKLCRHGQTSSSTGTIQPLMDEDAKEPRECFFTLDLPSDQPILQISCSVISLISHGSYLQLNGVSDGDVTQPIVNKIYTLRDTGALHLYSRFSNEDWFSCSWTTIQAGTTTTSTELATTSITDPVTTTESQSPLFTLCRDFEVYSSSGKVQPLGNLTTGEPRYCDIAIYGPADQFMQMSCSTINLKSAGNSFVLNGFSEYYLQPPILNRIYTSYSNLLVVSGKFSKDDWFECEWKPWNRPPNATDFKVCQQGTTKNTSGTIHQLDNLVKGEIPRKCSFHVISLDYDYGNYADQRAQFSCSFVSLVNPESYLQIANTLDMGYIRVPVVNRTYVSNFAMYQQYLIFLDSFYTYGDQFECKWEPYIPPTTNDFQSCRDVIAKTTNGTFQPFRDFGMEQPRMCDFTIQVPSGRSVQFTCSVVNLTTSESYLQLRDWNGAIIADPPVANQNYTSKNYSVVVTARFIFPDWFNCRWITVAVPPVTEPQQPVFQMCNDHEARTFNGTLQPYKEQMTGLFNIGCRFFIYAPLNYRVQMTCSVVRMNPNYTNSFSFIKFYEMNDTEIAAQPIENEIYTSFGNVLYVWSFFTNTAWFDCSWTLITPADSTMNTKTFSISTSTTEPSNQQMSTTTTSEPVPIFKACSEIPMYTTSVKGKIQHTPDNVNPELRNWCSLLISSAPSDQRIQFSCSIINISASDTISLQTMGLSGNNRLVPVVNTIYTSNYDNIYVGFSIANKDWFECEWTTIPGSSTAVREFKLCRDTFTMSSFGTLQPFTGNLTTNEWGTQCSFSVFTHYLHQIEISCSVINFTTPGSSLQVNDLNFPEKMQGSFPVLDRKYYVGNGATTFVSNIGKSDWFECQWATIPVSSEKTDFKLCQDSTSMVSEGTIQPLQDGKGSQRECSFYKSTNTEHFVHIYCPVVNLITPGSFLKLQTVFDEIFANPPVANEIYTVTTSDSFGVVSQFTGADSFECKWTTVLPTSQPPIQQETTTTTPTSTIAESPSPIGMTTPVIETTTVWCATCNSIGGSCWTFSSTSGTIQSINFPNQDYAIGARIPGNKTYFESYFFIESRCGPIKLTFNTFNVQPGGDTMLVYDGIPNPLPSGERGQNIESLWSAGSLSYAPDYSQFTEFPPVITSKSDKMTILFFGDTLENTQLIASKRPARWQATYTIG